MFNILPWERPVNIRRERHSLSSLQNEINQVFDEFFSGLNASWTSDKKMLTPVIDIIENDKNFKLEAELPGMDQDDIEVSVNDNFLTIKGEKNAYKEDKDENYVRRERSYGSYLRTITLPDTADGDKAKATFKKGVLWVEIPKKAAAIKPAKKLEIKSAA